jgi:hypothetical protein
MNKRVRASCWLFDGGTVRSRCVFLTTRPVYMDDAGVRSARRGTDRMFVYTGGLRSRDAKAGGRFQEGRLKAGECVAGSMVRKSSPRIYRWVEYVVKKRHTR